MKLPSHDITHTQSSCEIFWSGSTGFQSLSFNLASKSHVIESVPVDVVHGLALWQRCARRIVALLAGNDVHICAGPGKVKREFGEGLTGGGMSRVEKAV